MSYFTMFSNGILVSVTERQQLGGSPIGEAHHVFS